MNHTDSTPAARVATSLSLAMRDFAANDLVALLLATSTDNPTINDIQNMITSACAKDGSKRGDKVVEDELANAILNSRLAEPP